MIGEQREPDGVWFSQVVVFAESLVHETVDEVAEKVALRRRCAAFRQSLLSSSSRFAEQDVADTSMTQMNNSVAGDRVLVHGPETGLILCEVRIGLIWLGSQPC